MYTCLGEMVLYVHMPRRDDSIRTHAHQKVSFQAFTAVSGSSSAEEGWTDTNACWETL